MDPYPYAPHRFRFPRSSCRCDLPFYTTTYNGSSYVHTAAVSAALANWRIGAPSCRTRAGKIMDGFPSKQQRSPAWARVRLSREALRRGSRSCDSACVSPEATRQVVGHPKARTCYGLGGHLKTGQRWTLQNRPTGGTRQEYLYTVDGAVSNHFFGKRCGAAYTESTWAEDTAPQGCDRSADSVAGMARSGASRSASQTAILARKR